MKAHFILTMGRSGSNTLRSMLNQNIEVYNFGEVLGPWTSMRRLRQKLKILPQSDEALLDFLLGNSLFQSSFAVVQGLNKRLRGKPVEAKGPMSLKSFGVKEFSLNMKRYGLIDYLERRPWVKVIGLRRLGVVERMVSTELLGQTGVVAVAAEARVKPTYIRIAPHEIAQRLRIIEEENDWLDQMLRALPTTQVYTCTYEDLYSDETTRTAIMAGIFDFLGVKRVSVNTRMGKIVSTPLDQLITNFDDCLRAVEGTKYEAMLLAAAGRGLPPEKWSSLR